MGIASQARLAERLGLDGASADLAGVLGCSPEGFSRRAVRCEVELRELRRERNGGAPVDASIDGAPFGGGDEAAQQEHHPHGAHLFSAGDAHLMNVVEGSGEGPGRRIAFAQLGLGGVEVPADIEVGTGRSGGVGGVGEGAELAKRQTARQGCSGGQGYLPRHASIVAARRTPA